MRCRQGQRGSAWMDRAGVPLRRRAEPGRRLAALCCIRCWPAAGVPTRVQRVDGGTRRLRSMLQGRDRGAPPAEASTPATRSGMGGDLESSLRRRAPPPPHASAGGPLAERHSCHPGPGSVCAGLRVRRRAAQGLAGCGSPKGDPSSESCPRSGSRVGCAAARPGEAELFASPRGPSSTAYPAQRGAAVAARRRPAQVLAPLRAGAERRPTAIRRKPMRSTRTNPCERRPSASRPARPALQGRSPDRIRLPRSTA
jgi:hypothetical protein